MKKSLTTRVIVSLCAAALVLAGSSCSTTYDAYGRPQQSVDPGVALAGVAAAGLIGYAIADNNRNDNYYRHGGYNDHHRGNSHYRREVCHY